MADDSSDDLESLFGDVRAATSDADQTDQDPQNQSPNVGASFESNEDTRKTQELQAEDTMQARKTSVKKSTQLAERAETALQRIAREAKEEAEASFYHGYSRGVSDGPQVQSIYDKKTELNELLAWKERLKLRSVTEFIPQSYYNSWSKEANLFFRRLVILKRRMKNLEK